MHERMILLKKIFFSSALIALLLAGCSESSENPENESPLENEETTEEVDSTEMEDENIEENDKDEEVSDSLVGAITNIEPIPIEDYAEDKWSYADLSQLEHKITNEVFKEGNNFYIGTDKESIMRLSSDFEPIWEDKNSYGYKVSFAIDEDHIYEPILGSDSTTDDVLKALNKESGEVQYAIDLGDYAEMSEILLDEEAIYLVLGKISDPEELTFADIASLHKFDKSNGKELWAIDFDGTRLGGGRSHPYDLTQSEGLIYLVEEDSQKLVARSKEDGSEVWSEEFGESDEAIRLAQTFTSGDSVYVIDNNYVFYAFDPETGEKEAEYQYNGEVSGAMVPFPVFYEDTVFWQNVYDNQHYLKAVQPKSEEELWTLDMDGHFLVDYLMVDDTLYAFFGSTDYDAEENTLMARINPETGEILDLVDMGEHMSAKYNNYYRYMGLTEHEGNLAYFYEKHLFMFNE